ncbi:MAG: 4-alpha-glucanotransferase [Planktotalea sp.]|uniref:4-alpha-glucanotransferase n=1 Tax=Planktotalea sp. TaxID=2029877 RepID=UPI003C719B86
MTLDHDLAALSELCGILPGFFDFHGNERVTSPDTQRAMLAANGFDVSSDEAIRSELAALRAELEDRWFPYEIIVESGFPSAQNFGLGAQWELRLDETGELIATGDPSDHITLPALPSGIYVLRATASGRTELTTVLAAPKRLQQIEDLTGSTRLWGLNFALYGMQSARNSGMGDFVDLAKIAQAAGKQGASFVGINPLHNMGFCDVEAISPYSPSHRGFFNTSYIALDSIPGIEGGARASNFSALRNSKAVDYRLHKKIHNQSLESLYSSFTVTTNDVAKADFSAFKMQGSSELQRFAEFEALSEIYGSDWRTWPEINQTPAAERVDFHMWMQWVAASQLMAAQASAKDAGMPLGLYLDLAVGSRRDGAEAWCEQSAVAQGVSIGAPPDHLSPEGQNWNLTAFSPRKLKAQRYAPLRRIIGQAIQNAGVIRIDHVLGLNRSFWLPDDGSPGAYIRQPFESLMAVIKIEAEQHNCAVIGEDLGLVPDGFRETMREHGFYGYSVLQYERDPDGGFRRPEEMPAQVLTCFATHDTPTVKGFEVGRDLDWWEKLSWIDAKTAQNLRQKRLSEVASIKGEGEFTSNVHARLAYSNASLLAVQLDDVLGGVETQNLPGTIDQHPNWRRKYDVSVEELPENAALKATANVMHEAGRSHKCKG